MSIAKLAVLSVAALPVFAPSGNALAGDAPLPTGIANPKVYVFPLVGQMGTDISEPIFKKLIEDAKKQKPDILVLKLKSADIDRINHLRNDNPVEFGLVNKMTEYRDMMKSVHDELSDIPQVMWVEDSVGVSGLAALAWDRMYMFSDARLGGLYQFKEMVEAQWDDADVRSKMVAAWTGIMKGLTQLGNNPDILADALIFSERTLSVNFEGRGAKWINDTSGSWVVDSSADLPLNLSASVAEDILLSDGSADTLDDLMFLLGYREYTAIDSGEKLGKQFTEDWRKAMKNIFTWMEEAAETEDSVQGLGKRKSLYEKVVAAFKAYPFIEGRRECQQQGINRQAIEGAIDDIKKELQRLREAEKENGGAGGGGGGGGNGRGLGGGGMGRPRGR
ncbi:MAG: hypothetical protein RLZZ116_1138 [Planctomycetota bacterium]|jgi:hypothetical protein